MKKYKFGIIKAKRIGNVLKTIGICSCGQHSINPYAQEEFQCEACGNEFFVDARGQHNEKFSIPHLEALRKDNRGFKVKRTNLSIQYKDGFVTPLKENISRTIEYDIVDGVLKVWRLDELEYNHETDSSKYTVNGYQVDYANKMFFTQMDEDLFLNFVSNEVTRSLYCNVVRSMSYQNGKKRQILRGLIALMSDNYKYLQILANAGVPEVNRFKGGGTYYYGRNNSKINPQATKPHEILQVPRFMMAYIREDTSIDMRVLGNLQGQLKNLDINKFKEIMSIVKDEGTISELSSCIDNVMQIHIDYGYTNIRKLILYLFREVRLTQGIDSPSNAVTYLRDYIRMMRAMGLEWDRYPKSLKKEHDVAQMNYRLLKEDDEQRNLFKSAVELKSYQSLVFGVKDKKQKYAIISPQEPDDLVKEGNQLSHCVASYVRDVMNNRCKILFLRDKEDLETPLATIEIRGLNIRQARGYGNRSIPDDQREFIKLWAEKNNLVEDYY